MWNWINRQLHSEESPKVKSRESIKTKNQFFKIDFSKNTQNWVFFVFGEMGKFKKFRKKLKFIFKYG